jgi:hypothetical protein
MEISYTLPLDLNQRSIQVELDKDFFKIKVEAKGYTESNKFLISLWNQINIAISPSHSPCRAPWAYFPNRYLGKKSHVLALGFLQTTLGELYIALSYRKKGDIDAIHFHNPKGTIKEPDKETLTNLVKKAIQAKDTTKRFLCQSKIDLHLEGVKIETYSRETFSLFYSKQSKCSFVEFYIEAIDLFEAEQIAMENLYNICAFLSVETNIRITFDDYTVSDNAKCDRNNSNNYVNDYIDDYPFKEENGNLCISHYALKFIGDVILSRERLQETPSDVLHFLSACKHIQLGMIAEERLNTTNVLDLPKFSLAFQKKDTKARMENMTSAMMSYISAIECTSATEGSKETCKTCGIIKYKIALRVKEFTSKYLGEHLGQVFHKLYGHRSKFLHEGHFPSDANRIHTLPLLRKTSDLGLSEFAGISVQIKGRICSVAIINVREWSTYTLRCFYQEKFCARTSFENKFSDNSEIEVPFNIVPAVLRKGG